MLSLGICTLTLGQKNDFLVDKVFVSSFVRLDELKPLSDAKYYYSQTYYPIKLENYVDKEAIVTMIVREAVQKSDQIYNPRYFSYGDAFRNDEDTIVGVDFIKDRIYDTHKWNWGLNPDSSNLWLIDSLEFISLQTNEYWDFNDDKSRFKKRIMSYAPIEKYTSSYDGEVYTRSLCLLKPQKGHRSAFIKVAKVSYEYIWSQKDNPLSDGINGSMPNFEEYSRKVMINYFIEKLNKREPIYDFESGDQVAYSDFEKYDMFYLEMFVDDMDIMIDELNDKMKSMIFTEEIYFNPKTLAIKKKVLSVAPVYWGADLGKIILFDCKMR